MLCQLVQVVNTGLHLCWEPLDVAIVERFVRDIVRGVHQGISGQRLRYTRGDGGLGPWTQFLAFLRCHRALSLHACSLSPYGMPLQYTMHVLLSARSGG